MMQFGSMENQLSQLPVGSTRDASPWRDFARALTSRRSRAGSTVGQHHVTVVSGKAAIRRQLSLLLELGERCSQPAAALYFDHFLNQPYTGGKLPHLLLFRQPGRSTGPLTGAVLTYEYRRLGLPLGIFVTEDHGGERNILGPMAQRPALALAAARHLLRTGARLLLLSLDTDAIAFAPAAVAALPRPRAGALLAAPERTLERRLPLGSTYDATLATLGSHTRRNLRAYRRRAVANLHCAFLPAAAISEEDFVALNHLCSYPTPDGVSAWRFQSTHAAPGGFLCGLQGGDGQWLSLLGGRRCDGTTYIDWQLNRLGFEEFSLSTVMRSFVLEHESALGTQTLLFEGGTPHSIRTAFRADTIIDLLVVRRSPAALALRRVIRSVLPATHPLVEALANPSLVWHPW